MTLLRAGFAWAALLAALLLPGVAAAEGAAIVLPPGGDARLTAERAQAEQALLDAVQARQMRAVTAADAAARLRRAGREPCEDITCAPDLLEALDADMAVLMAVWGRRQGPGASQVGVTLVDRAGARAEGSAAVDGDGVGPAATAAFADALSAWDARGGIPIRVEGSPVGAAVTVDRHPRGALPLELSLAPGTHSLSVSATGYVTERRELDVSAETSETRVVRVHLSEAGDGVGAEPTETASSSPPNDPVRDDGRAGPSVLGPALLGLAGVGLLAVDVVALLRTGCLEAGPSGACVRERRLDGLTFALYGVAGVAAIGGALLWYLLGQDEGDATPTVGLVPGGAVVGLRL